MHATNGRKGRAAMKHRSGWHGAINSEIVAVANSGNVPQLIGTIQKHLPDMNLVNVTTAIHRLAKLVDSGAQSQTALARHPVTQALTSAAEARLKSINTDRSAPSCQSLSNVMWSMAVLQISDWALLQEVGSLTVNYIAYFKPLELSTLLWASAKITPPETLRRGHWADSVFDAAVDYIRCNVQTFTFRNLITAAGAFATVKKKSPSLFQTVAEQMMKVINTANRLELAKTAWAFGTASVHNEKLFNVVAKHAIPQLQSFQPQELSNLLWGFASNEVFHHELFTKASSCAQRMDLNAQQLANILWALTRMRPQWPVASKTMRALMPRCCEQLPAFKPQEFATIAIAAAKVFGHVGEELGRLDEHLPSEVAHFFVSALPIILPRLHEFSKQSLANVATAYTAVQATGVMVILTQVGHMVLSSLDAYDPPLLLQLIRTFSTDFGGFDASAEQQTACHLVSGALFYQAARLLDHFGLEERRSLAQLCSRYRGSHSDFNVDEELQQECKLCSTHFMSRADGDQRVQVHFNPLSLQTALNVENNPGSDQREVTAEGSTPTSQSSDLVFQVKNTFLEPVHEYIETPWVSPHVLSKPPLDFLKMHKENIQAIRENYQLLKAVPGLDVLSTSEKTCQTGKDPQKSNDVPVSLPVVESMNQARTDCQQSKDAQILNPVTTPRGRDRLTSDTGNTQAATLERESGNADSSVIGLRSPERHGFESAAIGAFRKDYQELRAVPGLDWQTEEAPWPEQGSAFLHGTSARMKQQNRCAELGSLPPPLPFLEESAELKACRQHYFATGEFSAVPGVDFSVPEKGQQIRDQLAVDADPVHVIPSRWLFDDPLPPLCEPKALSKPPLDFLDDMEKICQAGKDPQKSNDVPLSTLVSKATASVESDLSASGSKNQQAATLENSPDCIAKPLDGADSSVRGLSSPERRAFKSAIIGVFRKDYQELRAVPGLDWKIEEAPWLEKGLSSLHDKSARMKQYNRCAELGSLPPPLPFLGESAEINALRKHYFATGEFSAIPGVDFSVPRKESAIDADPLLVTPSRWLFDDPPPPLCAPKAVSSPPIDFGKVQAKHPTERVSQTWQQRKYSMGSTSSISSRSDASGRRLMLEREAIRAFRRDYQELRAVPGLDWKIQDAPW